MIATVFSNKFLKAGLVLAMHGAFLCSLGVGSGPACGPNSLEPSQPAQPPEPPAFTTLPVPANPDALQSGDMVSESHSTQSAKTIRSIAVDYLYALDNQGFYNVDYVQEIDDGTPGIQVGDAVLENYHSITSTRRVLAIGYKYTYTLDDGQSYVQLYINPLIGEYNGIAIGHQVRETHGSTSVKRVRAIARSRTYQLADGTWYDEDYIVATHPRGRAIAVGDQVIETHSTNSLQQVTAITETAQFLLEDDAWYHENFVQRIIQPNETAEEEAEAIEEVDVREQP